MLVRIVKYFVSVLSEPIVRATLNVLCRLQGFRTTRVNNWVFRGPPDFIRLVNEAEKRLLQKAREFGARGCAPLHALQLLPDSPIAQGDASDGSRGQRSHVWSIEETIDLLC